MHRPATAPLCLPDPLALIDATLTFTVQVLIAQHPELLLPPEVPILRPPPGLRAARHVLTAIKELHHVLESYQAMAADSPSRTTSARPAGADDIPF
jgi:hypothetical protein